MSGEITLQEDDCAPDARKYFVHLLCGNIDWENNAVQVGLLSSSNKYE